jgi:ribonuclease BN (tRNA processing enzyme)
VRVTVLGSGDAFGSGGRLHSSYLVEAAGTVVLVDCGPSVLQGLKRAGIDPGRIDAVVLSHLHGDHFGGVPFLFMEYRYEAPRERPLAIYGPTELQRRVEQLFAALYEKTATEPPRHPIEYVTMRPGTAAAVGGLTVEAFPVPHAPELECFAYRITGDGRSVLYSGDTAWTEGFRQWARDVDLFVCECSTFETRLDLHISYPEIAARAAGLGCRRLVLSHLGREPLARRAEITLECAEDGMVIDL